MKKTFLLLALIVVFISGCIEEGISDEELSKAVEDYKEKVSKPQTVRDLLEDDMYYCKEEAECEWVIANCCTENAGAIWLCANKNRTKVDCPEGRYDCTQNLSPKPTTPCWCVNGECKEVFSDVSSFECPEADHLDCMPAYIPENEDYCQPEYRTWIEKNCDIGISD